MNPIIMDGKKLSSKLMEEIKLETTELKKKNIVPGLAVILVGEDPASQIYVRKKEEACKELGFNSKMITLPADISESELKTYIEELNYIKKYNAILCQLPLPKHLNPKVVLETISEFKDVDVLKDVNLGKIMTKQNIISPCTPTGIFKLLEEYNIDVEGKHCVIVGRSNIVGKPLGLMMLNANATVSICHTKTQNLKEMCSQADILVAAAGCEKLITADMVKEGAILIDVGINRNENNKICGDIDKEAYSKASYITPVPGGIGPTTISMLMYNTLMLTKQQYNLL